MLTPLKALVVFALTAIVGLGTALLYGIVAHFFDLFIVLPFIVAGAIVAAGKTTARWTRFKSGGLLLLIGCVLGVAAYPVYLGGKYAMLVGEFVAGAPTQLTDFSPSLAPLAALQNADQGQLLEASKRTDDALRAAVGQGGLVGQLLLNMQAGMPIQTRVYGAGNPLVGGSIELFKFAVMALVSGSALRETVRVESLLGLGRRTRRDTPKPRQLSAEEEELWGKGS